MNKKLLQKVAIASVAALIAMPNLVIQTNSYASNVIGPAGSPVSEGNRTIAGDNSDVAIPDGDYTGKAYNSTYTGAGYAISEAEIKRHIKKNKNPNNPAKYYNDLGKGRYFRDSKSGNIFTADGGSAYIQSLLPTQGKFIEYVNEWGAKCMKKNPNYNPNANEVDNSKIYDAVEKAVFLLNNPGVSYDDWGCSYAAQPYKVYDASRGGLPAWVNRNKEDCSYTIFGEKCYPQVAKQYPMKMFHQWSQNNMLVFQGWSLVYQKDRTMGDVIQPVGVPQHHHYPANWQPDMTNKEDVFVYWSCLEAGGDIVKENQGSATAPLEALRLQVEQTYMNMK